MLCYNYDVFYEQKETKMENNLNENFTLTEEQIIFIDDGFINKGRELKDVVKKLVAYGREIEKRVCVSHGAERGCIAAGDGF